ncbi:AMP-binding protein [Aureimonas mangrovi]|uniref:AMP-binding protein n=1 Tax=Aureimonas mangrovi TaxID=2758041 RepID=UPI001FE495E7|nr:AMP-binding protein [Aureimonas mangrovi]
MDYRTAYANWRADPDRFWLRAAKAVDWIEAPARAFSSEDGVYGRWFPDAVCNTCHNALDRHVAAGHGQREALLYDSPVTGTKRRLTYGELLREVQAFSLTLADLGVTKGDRVILYMPMVPEAVVAMLACARLGAVHSVVFGGFAARELAVRIDDAKPKVVVSASCGIEPKRVVAYKPLLDKAIEEAAHKPDVCIILQRPQQPCDLTAGRDHDWGKCRARAIAEIDAGREGPCTPVRATDPLYILYTSGTTGRPKGVVRDNGGHLVSCAWSLPAIYDIGPGEVIWTASDVGWVVGHTYIVYAPLICGATSVLYEGKPVGTPDAGAFWRVCAEYSVKALFTAPTAIRAVRKEDPGGTLIEGHDLSKLRTLFLAGERADPETVRWAERVLKRPVVDHWWQTESGWPIAANPVGLGRLAIKHGSASVPMPGWEVEALDEAGKPQPRGELGAVAIRLPLPPGAFPTLWNDEDRMRSAYLDAYPGWYSTADAGMVDEDGYVWIMGRTDDVINVAGHRLSTGGIEEVVATHPDVAECAVIGVRDDIKGETPCTFVVLKSGANVQGPDLTSGVSSLVREHIGAVASLSRVVVVDRLPKTRSGKILRATMKKIAESEPYPMPATIEDPAVLDEIESAWRSK